MGPSTGGRYETDETSRATSARAGASAMGTTGLQGAGGPGRRGGERQRVPATGGRNGAAGASAPIGRGQADPQVDEGFGVDLGDTALGDAQVAADLGQGEVVHVVERQHGA